MGALKEFCFGQHLIIDAYGCRADRLANINFIYNFLDEIVEKIGMHKICPPVVFNYNAPVEEDSGISGFVLIAESHISIHTFPQKKYISIDIFSCKKFNTLGVTEEIKEKFGIQKYEMKILDRGHEYPKIITDSKKIVVKDREGISNVRI